jgi:hypothetical protein
LSSFGPAFARRLAPHAEVWLGTEFFNILDSASVYSKEPELLFPPGSTYADTAGIPDVLRDWSALRDEAGYGGSPFHWIGDVLRESSLPDGMSDDMVDRWEGAARSLDNCLPRELQGTGPLVATMRDTVSLCAVLPAVALMLCDGPDTEPVMCQNMERWGIGCEYLNHADGFVETECNAIRQLLVQAGLAKFVWAGLNLAVLHLFATRVGRSARELSNETEDVLALTDMDACRHAPWDGAKAYWYRLSPERHHAS